MTESFSLKLDEFEGPLPLLLELVEKRQLSISQVSLAEVADNFIKYVNQLNAPTKAMLAEFIVVASTLMLIKSISLLPALTLEAGESQEIGELERRLKLYQIIRQIALDLKSQFGRQVIFYPESRRSETVTFSPTAELTLANLLATMKNLIQSLPATADNLPHATVRKIVSLEDTIKDLTNRVQNALRMNFSDFVKNQSHDWQKEKVNIIISFLALLELCKRGLVEVEQGSHFAEIKMETKITSAVPRYDII